MHTVWKATQYVAGTLMYALIFAVGLYFGERWIERLEAKACKLLGRSQ